MANFYMYFLVFAALFITSPIFSEPNLSVYRVNDEQQALLDIIDKISNEGLDLPVEEWRKRLLNGELVTSEEIIAEYAKTADLDQFFSKGLSDLQKKIYELSHQQAGLLDSNDNKIIQDVLGVVFEGADLRRKNVLFLFMSDFCEALLLSPLKFNNELDRELKKILLAQARAIRHGGNAHIFAFENAYGKWNREWVSFQEKAQIHLILNRVNRLALDIGSLIKADAVALNFDAEMLKKALVVLDEAKTRWNEKNYDATEQLYEATLRGLFPTHLSVGSSNDDLQGYLRILTMALHLKVPVEDFKKSITDGNVADLIAQQKIEDSAIVYAFPQETLKSTATFIESMKEALNAAKGAYFEQLTFMQSFSKAHNQDVIQIIEEARLAFDKVTKPMIENIESLSAFYESRHLIQHMVSEIYVSAYQRLPSVKSRSLDLIKLLERIENKAVDFENNNEVYKKLQAQSQSDTTYKKVWQAYLSRGNFQTAALSALIIAEVLSLQWQSIPHTLSLVSIAGRAALAGGASLNLADRTRQQGGWGLVNLESALDLLMLLAYMPYASPRAVLSADVSGKWSRFGQHVRNNWAFAVRDAGKMIVTIHAGLGIYQVGFAESISDRMRKQGVHISARDVRLQGLKQLAIAMGSHFLNARRHKQSEAKFGDSYRNEIEKVSFKNTITGQALRSFDPRFKSYLPRGVWNYFDAVRSNWARGGWPGKSRAVWSAFMIPLYSFVIVNEAAFFAFTTPDFYFENKTQRQEDLPVLNEGESAVFMIGLDPSDLLYAAGRSIDYQRNLREFYGSDFYVYDFASPDDFFKILRKHALKYGKIRYLKILTHGLPGMLATNMALDSPIMAIEEDQPFNHLDAPGYINIGFLKNSGSFLKEDMRQAMAADAMVNLTSCLAGSDYKNFEKTFPANHNGIDNIGDEFLDAFAEVLLPHRGRLDSSTRALIGVDMVYSSLFVHDSLRRTYNETQDSAPVLPLSTYRKTEDGSFERLALIDENDRRSPDDLMRDPMEEPIIKMRSAPMIVLPRGSLTLSGDGQGAGAMGESFLFMTQRIAMILPRLPLMTYYYGIALEGPMWGERIKSRIVE